MLWSKEAIFNFFGRVYLICHAAGPVHQPIPGFSATDFLCGCKHKNIEHISINFSVGLM